MRKKHLCTSFALITALSVQMLAPTMGQPVMAATKKKANKESVALNVGEKVNLEWLVYKKAVSWKNSNKKVVRVKKTGKTSVVVTGKKVGTAKVTAKVKGKTFTQTIKVRKKKSTGPAPTVQPSTVYQGWTPTTSNTTGSISGANTSATLNPNPTVVPGGGIDPSVSTTTPGAVTTDRKFNYRPIDTSRPAKLDAKFYLSDFEEGQENSQFVNVNICNNMTEDILIEPEAYIQTDGICYPALNYSSDLLFEIEGGDNKTEATSTPKVTESPKTTSTPEASSEPEETGEPKETTAPEPTKTPGTTPETDEPEETGEPDVTQEPEDPWDVDVTPEPEETDGPHATLPPEESSGEATLENVRVEMEQIPSDGSYVSMTIYNDTEEELVVKSGAYVTTDGVKYMAMQYDDEKEDGSTILAGSSDYMTYRTVEYMTNVDDYELWDFPINEDSTFTFSFTIGGKEYQAVIDLADGKVTYSTIDSQSIKASKKGEMKK